MPEQGRKPARKTAAGSRAARPARRPKAAAATADRAKTGAAGADAGAAPRRAARKSAAGSAGAPLTIEQTGSGIGCLEAHKRTLRALGLRHPRQRVVRPDNPAIRGMVAAIRHLVRIVEG